MFKPTIPPNSKQWFSGIYQHRLMLISLLMLLLAGCQFVLPTTNEGAGKNIDVGGLTQQSAPTPDDIALRTLIVANELTGDPSTGRDLPSIDSPIAQLGKKLFFTKALGGDMDAACVSCHHPQLGGGDGLALPIGTGAHNPDLLGPGRTHPNGVPNVPRNSPTTFNVGMWDKALFWDGRVESLGKTVGLNGADGLGIRTPDVPFGLADPVAGNNLVTAQARFPVTSNEEMRGHDFEATGTNDMVRQRLAARIGGYDLAFDGLGNANRWLDEFEAVFGSAESIDTLITEQRIAFALAEYERSQLFVNTPWKAYVQGDNDALSMEAKQGALLFYQPVEAGGANCASCHSGDFLTDEGYHAIAIPQVGPGKETVTQGADDGRFRETRNLDDLFAFRTPTLLNVAVTGPYGHDGAYTTLEGMVRHHLNPLEACREYDMSQLDPSIPVEYARINTDQVMDKIALNRARGLPTITNITMTDTQVDELVAFLHALTDPCVTDSACLSPWVPSADELDPDGQRLIAVIPSVEK